MKKKIVLWLISVSLLFFNLHGQEMTSFQPSSNSAGLVKSMQTSIQNNGSHNIVMPLASMSSIDVEIPVTLSYNTSGIKIDQRSTSVGLGWNLSAGGKVTRVVNRFPDEQNEWFKWTLTSDQQIYDKLHSGNISPYQSYRDFDMEPDLFFFEIPGKSGMFVFDHSGVAHTIPYQSIKIEWVNKSYFRITDDMGNVYKLGEYAKETTKNSFTNPNKNNAVDNMEYTSTWWLERIDGLSGDIVYFTYETGPEIKYETTSNLISFNIVEPKKERKDYKVKEYKNTVTIPQPRYIKEISSAGGRLVFTSSVVAQLDMLKRYDKIDVLAWNNTTAKSINLKYATTGDGEILLTGITERITGSSVDISNLTFSYHGQKENVSINKMDYDHWGYYNKKGNTSHFPKIDISYKRPFTADPLFFICTQGDADRNPDLGGTIIYNLHKIEDPNTITEYIYELNDVDKDGKDMAVGGLRVKEVIKKDRQSDLKQRTKYSYISRTTNKSSGIPFRNDPCYYTTLKTTTGKNSTVTCYITNVYPKGFLDVQDKSGVHIEYSMITEHHSNGSRTDRVYRPTYLKGSNPYLESSQLVNDPYGFVYYENNRHNQKAYFDDLDVFPTTTRFWRRGLLRELSQYNADNICVNKVEYDYSFGQPKAIIEAYSPMKQVNHKGVYIYEWISETIILRKETVHNGPFTQYSETNYEYDLTYMLPTKIAQKDNFGNTSETMMKYPFSYNLTYVYSGNENSMALKHLMTKRAVAVPIETITLKNGRTVGASMNLFIPKGLTLDKTLNYYPKTPSYSFSQSVMNSSGTLDYDSDYQITSSHYIGDMRKPESWLNKDGVRECVIYDNRSRLPVARVVNAWRDEVFYSSIETEYSDNTISFGRAKSGDRVLKGPMGYYDFSGLRNGYYMLSYWYLDEVNNSNSEWKYAEKEIYVGGNLFTLDLGASSTRYVDEVRLMPENAVMTTCTYFPGIGKSSETDAAGRSTHYKYQFGLLSRVYDNEWKLVKKITYDNF